MKSEVRVLSTAPDFIRLKKCIAKFYCCPSTEIRFDVDNHVLKNGKKLQTKVRPHKGRQYQFYYEIEEQTNG